MSATRDHGRDHGAVVPLRAQLAVYATGAFGNTTENVFAVILPLWAVVLDASPLWVGILIGARHWLAALLAIHGGALMDRLGTRRVLVAVGLVGAVTPLLFPALPWLWAAFLLQLIGGLSSSFGWLGAQTQLGEVMKGGEIYAGRMTVALRAAQLAGPPLAGLAWDLGGPMGGFALLAAWGVFLFAAILALPRPPAADPSAPMPGVTMRDLLPRASDYLATFRLLMIPAIGLVIALTLLRISGNAINFSFYVVYLQGVGFTGTTIGVLVAASSILGFAGAVSVAPLARRFAAHWLLVLCVLVSIVLVCITPLLGGAFILLLLASAARGGVLGLSQPLMISMLARAAGQGNYGKGAGLRTSANRLTSSTIPVVMGAVVELVGLEAGFYVFGTILVALVGVVALHVRRSPGFEPGRDTVGTAS